MSRVLTSPDPDDRSTKRSRTSHEPVEMDKMPENIADIVPDGDVVLVLSGLSIAPQTPIGLRVSKYALSMASPVFKSLLATASSKPTETISNSTSLPSEAVLSVTGDDSDAMYILANILHLRNDKLPPRITPETLCALACLAHKYQCVVAAGRATLQWFDHLYSSKEPGDVWKIVEAAYLLNEAAFFARFTARWVLEQPVCVRTIPSPSTEGTVKLTAILSDRRTQCAILLRDDLDALIDPCTAMFSRENRHFIDWAPEMTPDPSETPDGRGPTDCRRDPDGAMLYLGALRYADIWPSTTWASGTTIGKIVEKLNAFREPDYDDADKCDFCDDVKGKFRERLETIKEAHKARLWGLCLDCFQHGGVNAGECRFEHAKLAKNPVTALDGLGTEGV